MIRRARGHVEARSALAFLHAELETGMVLSRIAATAKSDEKKQRNRINARRAYDSILHYLPGSYLSPTEASEFEIKLDELRSALKSLGEVI